MIANLARYGRPQFVLQEISFAFRRRRNSIVWSIYISVHLMFPPWFPTYYIYTHVHIQLFYKRIGNFLPNNPWYANHQKMIFVNANRNNQPECLLFTLTSNTSCSWSDEQSFMCWFQKVSLQKAIASGFIDKHQMIAWSLICHWWIHVASFHGCNTFIIHPLLFVSEQTSQDIKS